MFGIFGGDEAVGGVSTFGGSLSNKVTGGGSSLLTDGGTTLTDSMGGLDCSILF